HRLQRLDALARLRDQLIPEPELDRLGGARLGAGRAQTVVDAVVTEGALAGRARVLTEADDAERARRDTVPAAVADALVDVDRAVLRPVDGSGGAGVETPRLRAVLADVGHEKPGEIAVRLGLLDEAHEAERLVGEVGVVLVGARPLRHLHAELVPLLAGHL